MKGHAKLSSSIVWQQKINLRQAIARRTVEINEGGFWFSCRYFFLFLFSLTQAFSGFTGGAFLKFPDPFFTPPPSVCTFSIFFVGGGGVFCTETGIFLAGPGSRVGMAWRGEV